MLTFYRKPLLRRLWDSLEPARPFIAHTYATVRRRNPRNDAIPYEEVWLVSSTGRVEASPTPLKTLLQSIDHRKKFIELVADEPKAIVRLMDRKEEFVKQLAVKKSMARNRRMDKEIQCTWHLADGDLTHKLAKVRKELERGNRVDLVFCPKQGSPLPPLDDRRGLILKVRRLLQDWAVERQPASTLGLQLVLHLAHKGQ